MKFLGLDLNCGRRFCDPAKHDFAGVIDEPRQAGVRAIDAAPAADDVSPMRGSVSRRTQGPIVLVSGPVLEHGIRAADLSREPARHRSLLARPARQALSP